jgi:hypothetical protein
LDNQPAFIQVGQRVPRIVATNLTPGGLQTNTIELENVGIILGVTPRISPDNTVVMEIDAEKSELGPEDKGVPISTSNDGAVVRSPSVDIQVAQATVSAASGETIILGGMITSRDDTITRRVPYLADVPVLGNLFRFDSAIERRAELLIILTPHVIRTPQDAQRLKETEMARMSWCAADLYEIHGDVGAAYSPGVVNDHDTEVIYPDLNPRGESIVPPEPDPTLEPPANELRDEGAADTPRSRVQRASAEVSTGSKGSDPIHRPATAPEPPAATAKRRHPESTGRPRRNWTTRLSDMLPLKSRRQESLE